MRVVAITGASAGIGRATAVRLARDGAVVAMCARRREMLEAAARDVDAAGGEALPIVADVTSVDDMERFVSAAVDRFGRLDVIVCNAGFGIAGTIDDISPDQMRKLVDINYMGTFYAARADVPCLKFSRTSSRARASGSTRWRPACAIASSSVSAENLYDKSNRRDRSGRRENNRRRTLRSPRSVRSRS